MRSTFRVAASVVLAAMVVGSLLGAPSCAPFRRAYHARVMRGSIIDRTPSGIYLCIGSEEGARVGQVLTVYRISKERFRDHKDTPGLSFSRTPTGTLRITEILDEHFAVAVMVSGEAEVGSVVELVGD